MDRSFLFSRYRETQVRFLQKHTNIQGRLRKGGLSDGAQRERPEACPPSAAGFAYIRRQRLDKMDNK